MVCRAATKDPRSAIKRVSRGAHCCVQRQCAYNTDVHTDDVIVQFVRSSGAGGQNVNKVSTKVDMRFNVRKTPWLEDDVKEAVERMVRRWSLCIRACRLLPSATGTQPHQQVWGAGYFVAADTLPSVRSCVCLECVHKGYHCSNSDNLEDALQKLQEILDNAWLSVQPIEEDPEKKKKLEKQCVRHLVLVHAVDHRSTGKRQQMRGD